MEKIADVASKYGKIRAIFGAIVGTIFGLIFLGIGIFLITRKDNYDKETLGTVLKSECKQEIIDIRKNTIQFNCNIEVTYTINDIVYTRSFFISQNKPININDNIELQYISSNPNNVRIKQFKSKYLGSGSISIAIIITIIVWISVWLTQKSKIYSTVTGSLGLASDISNVTKNIFT